MSLAQWGLYSTRYRCFLWSLVHLLVFHLIWIHSLYVAPDKAESFVEIFMDVAGHLAPVWKGEKMIFFSAGKLAHPIIHVLCSPTETHI